METIKANTITINPNKLFTKMAYKEKFGTCRATIDRWIKEDRLKTLQVNGVTLIRVA